MKKIISCLLLLAALAHDVSAQDEFDALRYSYTTYQGTARGIGIGSALGSIGADFSCLSINPAGIGIYKNSEFMLSPSFSVSTNKSTYLESKASANDAKFNLSNFGIIVVNKLNNPHKKILWKTFTFGFGMNRLATFKNEYAYTGKNYSNSLTERFADDFNKLGGINSATLAGVNFSAYGAYLTYLLDKGLGADSNKAVSYVPYKDGLNQTKKVTETGGMSEYAISIGGNYMEKLMLGATLGISSVKYDRILQIDEEDASGKLNNDFKYMHYTENLATSGNGVNLKLGAIFKPNPSFRFGLALHTPTHLELNDASNITIESHTDSLLLQNNPSANPVTTYTQDSALVFNYSLNTPSKALISAMVLFGKMGFVTVDAEYVNYQSMKYNFGVNYQKEAADRNNIIKDMYKEAVNIRAGAELKVKKVSMRAGVAYYGSPYSGNSHIPYGSKTCISAGLGYREQYWFIDATYIQSMQKGQDIPYTIARENANVQAATITNNRGTAVVTLGVKF